MRMGYKYKSLSPIRLKFIPPSYGFFPNQQHPLHAHVQMAKQPPSLNRSKHLRSLRQPYLKQAASGRVLTRRVVDRESSVEEREQFAALKKALRTKEKILVISGAGLSTNAGSTFSIP
jgi:hypothetical protein